MNTINEIIPIPNLPTPNANMSWRDLNAFRMNQRGSDFYVTCLSYAQFLWSKELPARAILCLDRALGAELHGNEACLDKHPLPYHALAFIIKNVPPDAFIGNPRVHFQHYADRLGPPRKDIRKWRSWACWAIVRNLRPDWPNDPKHTVVEPQFDEIERNLRLHGHTGEAELWRKALDQ